jgi:hypothetical protein
VVGGALRSLTYGCILGGKSIQEKALSSIPDAVERTVIGFLLSLAMWWIAPMSGITPVHLGTTPLVIAGGDTDLG